LRRAAGHPIVFERSCGIEALMLENDPIQPAIRGRPRTRQQGRVSFAKRDNVTRVLQERDQLAITPHPTLFDSRVVASPFSPGSLEFVWIQSVVLVSNLE